MIDHMLAWWDLYAGGGAFLFALIMCALMWLALRLAKRVIDRMEARYWRKRRLKELRRVIPVPETRSVQQRFERFRKNLWRSG